MLLCMPSPEPRIPLDIPGDLARGRTVVLYVAWTREERLREYYHIYVLDTDKLGDWLIPGPLYRIHNVYNLLIYIYARFYKDYIRIGGCALARALGRYVAKALVQGDLDEFRKFARKFALTKNPLKFLRDYVRKKRAQLVGPGQDQEL